ncbi:MAG TPA: choice-of-anchor D domain-containing protein [Kofleriaceae bacterium]
MGQRFVAVAVVVASACTALHYSTTSQRAVVVSNNPYHFSLPGSASFVVSPQGSGDDDIIDGIVLSGCSSQWSLNLNQDPQGPPPGPQVCGGLSMPSGQLVTDFAACPRNYQFGVGYSGSVPGLSSCDVLIYTSRNGGSGSAIGMVTLMLSGSGAGPTGITVSPSMINFGDIQIGSASSSSTVTVKNNSTNTTVITVNGSLNGSGYSATPGNYGSFGLGPGSQAAFAVTCMPIVVGSYPGSMSFSSGSSSGMTTLACSGINSTVTIQPSQVNFDPTLVGRPPPPKTVMIGGNSTAVIENVQLDPTATAAGVSITTNPEGMTVGPGRNIVLAYSAAAMHAAGPLGNLSVKVSSDPAARNVAIAGQALLGGVGTNPASVEFGAVCANGSSSKDVEVYASEPGDVNLMSITKPAAPFDAVVVDTLPKTLGGNHSGASVTVRAELNPTTAGEFNDAFALNSNVPNMGTSEVQLHATVLAGGIAATPDIVHFGTVMPPQTSSPKMVQLTNCGSGDLMFTGASITGLNAGEFTLIGANPPRSIPPTESEVFMVIMQPDNGGFKTARLVIAHSAGGTNVDLDGTGEGEGNIKDRETYYACSTGRGAALWPLALALLALRRRRRR